MFDSKLTDFKVTNSPYGQDLMKMLAQAIRARGMRIGWYYSPRDWHHPDYLPKLEHDAPNDKADLDRYFLKYMKGQITELIENYGKVDMLWFDGSDHEPNVAHTDDLVQHIRQLEPSLLINDRVGKDGYEADFGIHEGHIPGSSQPRPWETCQTLNY